MARKSVIWPCARIEGVEAYFCQLEAVIAESSDWTLHRDRKCPQRVVLAEYAGRRFDGQDLRMCVSESGWEKGLVDFAPTATVWSGLLTNNTTVTDEKINIAFGLFSPLARRAAKELNIPLSIILSKPRRFDMPEKLKELVDRFVFVANQTGLHPCDWERFYEIVHHAHRYGIDMRRGDLAREFAARQVSEKIVSELAGFYDFGRSLLARSFTWE